MQNKTKKGILVCVMIIAIAGALAYIIYAAFFDLQRIGGQRYLAESTSPSGTFMVTAYLNDGGATTSFAVLGVLKNNLDGKQKNIYWQNRCEKAEMTWLGDEIIIINDLRINVKFETYDFRR